MWEDEIDYYEKLFEKDSKYKKRIARGALARASRKKVIKKYLQYRLNGI